MVRTLGGSIMQVGDLFRYIDRYDNYLIGYGSIGLIVEPKNKSGQYYVFINGRNYLLPFHHIEEIK